MHSLGFKVFLSYWLAVMLVIVVSDTMGPDSLRRPVLIKDAVVTIMQMSGQAVIAAYERGGCAEIQHVFPHQSNGATLADAGGKVLCGPSGAAAVSDLAKDATRQQKLLSRRLMRHQLVAIPLRSQETQKPYVFAEQVPYSSPIQLFGWFPGPTVWITCLLSSIVLTIIFTLPLRRLRNAARSLAEGDMTARVQWRGLSREGILARRDEMHALMRDFNHMASCLQALVESQRMLLRDVSHELRSPLARLLVALELAREGNPENVTAQHLDRIQRETDRLNDLITQLLSLSALQQPGHGLSEASPIELNRVLQELAEDAQFEASAQNCSVTLNAYDRNLVVEGSESLIRGAIENVVRNAIHYSGKSGLVDIKLATVLEDNVHFAVISVSDNGPGIKEEELRKIFRPFYRTDQSREQSTGRFGIGLAIVERSVRLHSGRIIAKNRVEGGLTIAIYLPLAAFSHEVLQRSL